MDTVFLDASVLFSAACRPKAKLVKLWQLPEVRLISSSYAAGEAARNLEEPEQRERLKELLLAVELVNAMLLGDALPEGIELPEKDAPILLGAIAANASHLLTTDWKHFGRYFRRIIEGVTVLPPAAYLKGREWAQQGRAQGGRYSPLPPAVDTASGG
jgi:predicted nucleic acid-binding protein